MQDKKAPYGALAPTFAQKKLIDVAQKSFLKRGTFRPGIARLLDMLRPGPIDVSFRNVPFRLRPLRSSADLGMIFDPDYNGTETRFLLSAIKDNGIFVDIGCNIGLYGLPIAKQIAARKGRVIGIEPHPEALFYLKENLIAAGLDNFTVVETAVGNFNGITSIGTDEGNLGASTISETGSMQVSVRTLLDILQEADVTRVDALKIDIEGYEDHAMMPFFAVAPQSLWPKAICIEHLGWRIWQQDIIHEMERRGYQKAGRTRCNLLLRKD